MMSDFVKQQFHHAFSLVAALLLALFGSQMAVAQTTVTADWTNLGNGNLQEVTDGTSLDVGPNVVTIDTNVVTDGDANDANFTNFYSTGMLSYFNGQVSSFTGNLLYSTNHTVFDAGDYFETTYSFDIAVTDLEFIVGNVDRFLSDPFFHDAVVIEYDTGSGTWQNLRNLGAFTLGSAVGTTTVNGQLGFHGLNYSGGITSTTGDIRVDFGTTTVERVRIRYLFGQASPASNPSGDWQYMAVSDFVWQQAGVTVSDLSLSKAVSNATPAQGTSVFYTLNLTNSSGVTASNVEVLDILPTGFSFDSFSGYGSYDSSTGIWSVPSIEVGQTRTINITGTVTAPNGVVVTNLAEIFSSPNFDTDSTPNNGSTTEDDDDSASFTVQGVRTAGTPPLLACPVGTVNFDWDTVTWAAGSTNNTYAIAGFGDINFAIATSGTWVNDPAFGGLSPALSAANTGGLAVAEDSLHQYLDFANRFQVATTVLSLPNGIAGTQFTVYDIDFAANDFADKLTVTGEYQGATVIPTLTNGVSNYVVGNTAVGDSGSDGTSGNGNVVVTFSQPIDTIIIEYGNANTAPANPDGQAIAIHDFTFCQPSTALSVTKTSSVFSDPVNDVTNPKAIPGALMEYAILVQNTGVSNADDGSVEVVDTVPANAKMCIADIGSGSPISFVDADNDSDLTFTYVDLSNAGDSVQFSDDAGSTWNYVPTADADGCDTQITNFRVIPSGAFAGGGDFTLNARFLIE